MLVLVKQMLIDGMKTYKNFSEADEAIASNILASKLKCLESFGFVERTDHPTNKKTKLYQLTDFGLSLTPIIVELALWSDKNLREFHPIMDQNEGLEAMKINKQAIIEAIKANYKANLIKKADVQIEIVSA